MGVPPRVVVIGAGPAGCAAALALARSGVFPLVVEKGLQGKDKACGDAWSPSATEELRSLDIGERQLGTNWRSFSRMDGYYAERKVWSCDLAPSEGAVAPRAIVDQLLRDRAAAAGCPILYEARATRLHVVGRRIELTIRGGGDTQTLAPSAVVLASGSGCHIAREAGLDGEPVLGAAVSAYLPTDGNVASPTLLFGEPSPGYAWVFPTGPRASNAGVCAASKSSAAALRGEMKALLARLGVSDAVPLRGGLGALWSGKGTAWSREAGVVACGDAGGLVDPITGEGLAAALISGKRAGAAIAAFLTGDPGALVEYGRWVRDWAGGRYAASIESRIFAAWVGFAPAERHLWALLAGARPRGERRYGRRRTVLPSR
jgi:menaquinone-9 beta-reductase